MIMHCTSTSGKIPAYFPEDAILRIPLSREGNCVAKYEVQFGGSKLWPYMLQGGLTSKPSKTYQRRGWRSEGMVPKTASQGYRTLLSAFKWQAAM